MRKRRQRLTRAQPLLHFGIIRGHANIICCKVVTCSSDGAHDAVVKPVTSTPYRHKADEHLKLVSIPPEHERTTGEEDERNDDVAESNGDLDKLA